MSTLSSYHWREQLLPGPTASTGYRTVLFVGTTGAGKTTLVRQLIGSDPLTEPFPATATFKTTTAETEVLCAPGDYYAVAVFAEKSRVRAEIEECVAAAVGAWRDGRPREVARDALAAHTDERLRLEYVLGPEWVDAALDTVIAVVDRRGSPRPPMAVKGSETDDVAAADDVSAEEVDALEVVRSDPELVGMIDHLHADVTARFASLRWGQILTDDDETWPRCWRFTTEERSTMFSALRRLAGNERGSHGTLLSPMVDALRLRGPLHPTWAAEIPYLMVIDTEGLGHVPSTASSLPVTVLEQLDRADRVVVVDDATHPMQAAPLGAIRQLVSAGQLPKMALCLTHADQVVGPNVIGDTDRRSVLRRAVNQGLAALREDLDPSSFARLSRQLDEHTYVLGGLHRRIDQRAATNLGAPGANGGGGDTGDTSDSGGGGTVAELRRLLLFLRAEAAAIELSEVSPAYRLGDLRSRLAGATEQFAALWTERLHRTHWRQVQALCRRIGENGEDGYGELHPVADLTGLGAAAVRDFVAHPLRWAPVTPADEQQAELFDRFSRSLAGAVRRASQDTVIDRARPLWLAAGAIHGSVAARRRLRMLTDDIFTPIATAATEGSSFIGDITDAARSTAESMGFQIGDVVVPAGLAPRRSRPSGRAGRG